jgi:type IV pilus assembly protein PilA
MKACPNCGQPVPDSAQTCPFCRAAQPVPGSNLYSANVNPAQTSGKAIGSLISGMLFFLLPAAIVAVVLGHISLSEINHSFGRLRGKGMAIAGLVLGYIGIAILPVVLLIAAIAIPNLLRSKMAADEASAVKSLRSYHYAAGAYAAMCPEVGFPASLGNLGPGKGNCERADFLDESTGTDEPVNAGYRFHYAVAERDRLGHATNFTINADPINPESGFRHFYVDYTGVVRASLSGSANRSSTPVP